MKITSQMLRKHGACSKSIKEFEKLFSEGATVTKRNVARALKAGLDLYWAAAYLLSAPGFEVYMDYRAVAWQAYIKTNYPDEKAYHAARTAAFVAAAKAEVRP